MIHSELCIACGGPLQLGVGLVYYILIRIDAIKDICCVTTANRGGNMMLTILYISDFDEKIPEVDINDVHDSGVSLNDFESTIRNGNIGPPGSVAPSSTTPDSTNHKVVRFDDNNGKYRSRWKCYTL